MAVVTGQKAVADHFGCDVRNVRHWMQSSDFPQPTGPKSDQYDLEKITAWRATQPQMLLRDKSGSAGPNSGKLGEANAALTVQLKQYKVEQAKEAALKARRERELFEGTLMPRRAMETFAAMMLSELGDWCDQLPELAQSQVPKKYQAKLRKWLEESLDARRAQLADDLKRMPEGKQD